MAQTAAQRQAAYRKRRPTAGINGERRLNTWISTGAALALKRLAAHHRMTQREVLERILLSSEDEVLEMLRGNEDEFNQYLSPPKKGKQYP
jgi:hypothetical protein